jgi:HSP20 family protein
MFKQLYSTRKGETIMAMDIFREMESLRKEIDNAFRGFGTGNFLETSFLPGISSGKSPQINMTQDENNFYAEILVPGIYPKDLELTVMRGVLTISGERKETHKDKTWHRRERGHGKFMRTLDLNCEVNTEKVTAKYENGLLFVTLPKHENSKPKKVSVKVH